MTRVILTYADYAELPDDGRGYELHEGELSVTLSPGTRHQRVKGNLFPALLHHIRAHRLGELFIAPMDCILSDITVVQPDILFVDAEHASLVSERAIEGAPTLAVEILSPSTVQIDRRRKAQLYASHGVPWYWIVDPVEQEVEAYALESSSYRLAAQLAGAEPTALPPFDDLLLDPAELWA
jgi:Uma2 family endonuclease